MKIEMPLVCFPRISLNFMIESFDRNGRVNRTFLGEGPFWLGRHIQVKSSRELFFYPSTNYLFIYTQLFQNLKGRLLKSVITWSELGQQTTQSKGLLNHSG